MQKENSGNLKSNIYNALAANSYEGDVREWEELTLSDNFIFQKVMSNKELCKDVLSEILQKPVVEIEYIDYEKTIDVRRDSKAIRLDVYIKGDEKVYNIEIQNSWKRNLPRRSRFYHDLIDLDWLHSGDKYEKLPDCIVIFICPFDLFEKGRYMYSFESVCTEEGFKLNDGVKTIFLNTYGYEGDISQNLKDFLQSVNGVFSSSEFSAKIKGEYEKVKQSREFRREYMSWYMRESDLRKEVTEEVTEKVTEEVTYNSIIKIISICCELGTDKSITIKKIMENFSLTQAEATELVEENWKE